VKDLIPLPAMLAQLRSDLLEAKAEGEGKDLRFFVDDIEIELQMATTQDKEGGVGIKFWVLNANAKGKSGATATQKLKLKLKAQEEIVDPLTGKRKTAPAKIAGFLAGVGCPSHGSAAFHAAPAMSVYAESGCSIPPVRALSANSGPRPASCALLQPPSTQFKLQCQLIGRLKLCSERT